MIILIWILRFWNRGPCAESSTLASQDALACSRTISNRRVGSRFLNTPKAKTKCSYIQQYDFWDAQLLSLKIRCWEPSKRQFSKDKKSEDVLYETFTFQYQCWLQAWSTPTFDLKVAVGLYFGIPNPLHWRARIHVHAPKLLVTEEVGQEIWSPPRHFGVLLALVPKRRHLATFWASTFRLDETFVFDMNAKQSIRNVRDPDNTNINNYY